MFLFFFFPEQTFLPGIVLMQANMQLCLKLLEIVLAKNVGILGILGGEGTTRLIRRDECLTDDRPIIYNLHCVTVYIVTVCYK